MKLKTALLTLVLGCLSLTPLRAAPSATTAAPSDRFEILSISFGEESILLKIDRASGATFQFTKKGDKSGMWAAIKSDGLPVANGNAVTFQILATPDTALLYNAQTGNSWILGHGPIGYSLYWNRLD